MPITSALPRSITGVSPRSMAVSRAPTPLPITLPRQGVRRRRFPVVVSPASGPRTRRHADAQSQKGRPMHHGTSGRYRRCRRLTRSSQMIRRPTRHMPGCLPVARRSIWRVRGMNDLGASAYSALDTFTVMTPPAKTTLVFAGEQCGQNVISDSVMFVWRLVQPRSNLQPGCFQPSTGPRHLFDDSDTTLKVHGRSHSSPTTTWKVEAINAGGSSYFTGAIAFTTVVAAPGVPTAVLPASAATNVARLTRFTWGPS